MTAYTATVTVRLKRGVLDPEAETTQQAPRTARVRAVGPPVGRPVRGRPRRRRRRRGRRSRRRDGRAAARESDDPRLRSRGRGAMTVSVVETTPIVTGTARGRPLEVVGVTVSVVQFGGSNCDDATRSARSNTSASTPGASGTRTGSPPTPRGSSSPAGSPTATTSAPARWPLAPRSWPRSARPPPTASP